MYVENGRDKNENLQKFKIVRYLYKYTHTFPSCF